jgi:hypothetical protein
MSRRKILAKLYEEYGKPAVDKIAKAISGEPTEKAVRAALKREGYKPLSQNPLAAKLESAAKPTYTRKETGPFLQVRRSDVKPRTVPEAREAKTIDDLRAVLADPEKNLPAQAAEAYNQQAFGRGYDTSFPEPGTSLQKQSGIARVFREAADENPDYKSALFERYGETMPEVVERAGAQNYDQLTEAAYRQLAQESRDQFDRLPIGMNYHYGEGEYATPSAMLRDILGEGNLNVFRGGDRHPFLSDVDPDTGLSANEMFRAVHDYFGHGTRGATFRPGGEELAYASHSQMMSPLAQMALAAETRGQNSFVNYSPINAAIVEEQNRIKRARAQAKLRADMRGERFDPSSRPPEEAARLRELAEQYQYAPQTPLLLPPEYLPADTAGGIPEYLRGVINPAAPSGPERAVHLSRMPDLEATDPSFYGTGHRGDDWRLKGHKGSPSEQTSFYLGERGAVIPEGDVEAVNPYAYETTLSNLYDLDTDPEGLVALARAYNIGENFVPDFKRMVREYGYTGYRAPFGPQYAANVYDPIPLERRIERGPRGYAEGGFACRP